MPRGSRRFSCRLCGALATVFRPMHYCEACRAPLKAEWQRKARAKRDAVRGAIREAKAAGSVDPFRDAAAKLATQYGTDAVHRALYATDGSLDLQSERINREHYQLMCDLAGVRRIA